MPSYNVHKIQFANKTSLDAFSKRIWVSMMSIHQSFVNKQKHPEVIYGQRNAYQKQKGNLLHLLFLPIQNNFISIEFAYCKKRKP